MIRFIAEVGNLSEKMEFSLNDSDAAEKLLKIAELCEALLFGFLKKLYELPEIPEGAEGVRIASSPKMGKKLNELLSAEEGNKKTLKIKKELLRAALLRSAIRRTSLSPGFGTIALISDEPSWICIRKRKITEKTDPFDVVLFLAGLIDSAERKAQELLNLNLLAGKKGKEFIESVFSRATEFEEPFKTLFIVKSLENAGYPATYSKAVQLARPSAPGRRK